MELTININEDTNDYYLQNTSIIHFEILFPRAQVKSVLLKPAIRLYACVERPGNIDHLSTNNAPPRAWGYKNVTQIAINRSR